MSKTIEDYVNWEIWMKEKLSKLITYFLNEIYEFRIEYKKKNSNRWKSKHSNLIHVSVNVRCEAGNHFPYRKFISSLIS